MKKTSILFILPILLLFAISLSACSLVDQLVPRPAPVEPAPACPATALPAAVEPPGACLAVDASTQPVLYGLWMKEQDGRTALITFTERSVYLVELDGTGEGYLRETFYEVQDVNWVSGVLTLQMKWVRINGSYGGFDDPAKLMKVFVEEEALFYTLNSQEQGEPASTDIGPWMRQ